MVDTQQRRWTGVIKSGKLSGYSVEVRQQHLPWRLYILAFTSPDESSEPEITFARGRTKLAEHFRALSIQGSFALRPRHLQHQAIVPRDSELSHSDFGR